MKTVFMRATALSCALLLPVALAATEREHGAHEHGHVLLQSAIADKNLEIAMQSPAVNILGFEHTAEADADRATLRSAEKLLGTPDRLFQLPSPAECALQSSVVESSLLEEHGGHEEHSEFHTKYSYTCNTPHALVSIDINLFKHFPGIEEIDVQVVSDKGQSIVELGAENTRVELP